MQVQLFGVGTKNRSPAITAQRRINCRVDIRKEHDKSIYAVVGRFGLDPFNTTLGANPSRGMWAVNSLTTPLLFSVHGNTLFSVNNAGISAVIGTIGTSVGDVSMVDDGTFLVLVDGINGYWYNMSTFGPLTAITDGNFTTTPKSVTWQDNYFIVSAGTGRQFQLSQITPSVDPAVWPAVQINFAGSGAGSLQACMADHSVLLLFGPDYTEFWQDTGAPDFPYAAIPGSAQEFGLAAAASLAKFDNSIAGLFKNKMGGVNVSRMSGFSLQKISDSDIDGIFSNYGTTSDAKGFAFMSDGHPMYVITFPTAGTSWMFDGLANIWTELQNNAGSAFPGLRFANLQDRLILSDRSSSNIYEINTATYSDNGVSIPVELWSKHIWNDDKYIGISQIQVDFQAGGGLVVGQGDNPVVDLQVSKDGGNSFYSVGYSSMGKIGEYTTRSIWRALGSARDWILKLRITDPVKVVITGASCEMQVARF